ncbi:MAG: TlpA disulfide reductase family protein [Casimicrobiaceae bacterium]
MNEQVSERSLTSTGSAGKRIPQWLLVACAGLLALAAGAYIARTAFVPSPVGKDASALLGVALPDLDGREQRLEQWRGKVLVVNFWATWCAPCREEMPQFIKAQSELGAKGLQFVGIAVDDAGKAQQFAKEINLNYPTLVGGMGAMQLSNTLGNDLMALPFTVVVGRDGKIVHTQLGPLKQPQLDALVAKLI